MTDFRRGGTRGSNPGGRRGLMLAGCLLVAAVGSIAAAETREQALEFLAGKSGEVRSWTADYLMLMNAQGSAVTTEGRMEVQGALLRNEMKIDLMGQSVPVVAVTGADGVTWTESNLFGRKTVMKMDAGELAGATAGGMNPAAGQTAVDPRQFVDFIRDTPEAVYLGREDLDGEEVLSFEVPLDEEMRRTFDSGGQMAQLGIQPEKLQVMMAARDGFPRLWQLIDAQDATVMSVVYRNLELNPEIPAARFQYAPAEGEQVMDLSALAGELLGNVESSESLSSDPQIKELLSEYRASREAEKAEEEKEEKEEAEDKPKYNQKYLAGAVAPAFTGKTLAGESINLADYKGQIVLLDFWGSFSRPYERKALPNLIEVAATHKADGLKIIGINLDEDRAAVDAFMAKHPEMTWPQVFDGKGWASAVGELYGIEAVPHRILIGKDGVILKTGMRGGSLMEEVDRALAE